MDALQCENPVINLTNTDNPFLESASTRHLQLKVQNSTLDDNSSEIWVLLSRHIIESSRKSDFMALDVHVEESQIAPHSDIDKVAQKVRLIPESKQLRVRLTSGCREASPTVHISLWERLFAYIFGSLIGLLLYPDSGTITATIQLRIAIQHDLNICFL